MRRANRVWSRWLSRLAGLLITGYLFYALALYIFLRFPYRAFPHRLQQGPFEVYSDAPIQLSFAGVLDEAGMRLTMSEFFLYTKTHRIFLCTDEETYAYYASLVGLNPRSQGFNVQLAGNIFISLPFISRVADASQDLYQRTVLQGNTAHIIAHEIAHSYIGEQLGFFAERRLPIWKREGYAEYAAARMFFASDSALTLFARIDTYIQPGFLSNRPFLRHYLRGQLAIAWLSEVKKLSFKNIMETELDLEQVLAEIQQDRLLRKGPK